MIACILGRQPELSLAELEQRFGAEAVFPFSREVALVESAEFSIEQLGGVSKAGRVVAEFPHMEWRELSNEIVRYYKAEFGKRSGKITFGISVYGKEVSPKAIQATGLALKQATKQRDGSLRLIPNESSILSTATSHHNKLGLSDNKVELLVVYGPRKVVIAESTGAQNITALARRDQGRPKRDAFVGMLPPKLALMMINMSGIAQLSHPTSNHAITTPLVTKSDETSAARVSPDVNSRETRREAVSEDFGSEKASTPVILDPFCGTGVVLQEAALLGYNVYGTDLSDKMIDYSEANMKWLVEKYHLSSTVQIAQGDAMTAHWKSPIDAVVAETYLGQPFSAPPSPAKLKEVMRNCDHIISTFLKNIHAQLEPNAPLCIAVPAWRDKNGQLTQLPLVDQLPKLGYDFQPLQHVDAKHLAYFREDQVVARQLLILTVAK